MKVLIDLKDGIVSSVLEKAAQEQMPFNAMISILVEERMQQIKSESEDEPVSDKSFSEPTVIIEKLIERVERLGKDEVFIVKEMLKDYWDQIHCPISFGRKAVKALLETGMVEEVPSRTASRKYKRI